jgi:hypothetical protein
MPASQAVDSTEFRENLFTDTAFNVNPVMECKATINPVLYLRRAYIWYCLNQKLQKVVQLIGRRTSSGCVRIKVRVQCLDDSYRQLTVR